MNITIICVGRLKEKYWTAATAEYVKRLSRWGRVNIIEVKDESLPESLSDARRKQAVDAEGERILNRLPSSGTVCTLEIGGKMLTSEEFAQKIAVTANNGIGQLTFIIGGSLGLSEKVTARSDWHCSFSPMTFPHQLFRVMLLEQLYRAFKINHHETYHK